MATGFDPAAFAAGAAAGSGLNNTVLGMINGGYGQIAGGDQADQAPSIGQRLLSGLQSRQEGYEQFSADAAKAKALRAVIKSYAADETDPDKQKAIIDQTHTAGLGELEGIVQGHVQALSDQKTKADINETILRGKQYQAFADARDQQVKDSQTTGQFMQNYLTAPKETDPDTGEETDLDPEERLKYAAKNTPGLSGRHFPAILDSLANWEKVQQGADAAGTPTQPSVTMLPVGKPGDPAYHEIPVLSRGKGWTQIDPGYGAGVRADAATSLEAQREAARQKLAPKDLLKSYQDELNTINNPMSWAGTTPEDRAAHRAILTGKIAELRGEGSGEAPPAAATSTGGPALSRVPKENQASVSALQKKLAKGDLTKEEFKAELGKLGIK